MITTMRSRKVVSSATCLPFLLGRVVGQGAGHAGGDISDYAGSAHAVLGSAAEAWEQHAAFAGARGSGGNEENVFAARIDDEGRKMNVREGWLTIEVNMRRGDMKMRVK